MIKVQQAVIVGSILGDGYLQKTGKNNARLRFEHSLKQKEYLFWKMKVLKNFFQSKPQFLERKNFKFNKVYSYVRLQSYSGRELGKLRQLFYIEDVKVVPIQIINLLKDPLSLAVWYMDDGYYYHRDRLAYIYIPKYDQSSINNLLAVLRLNFSLNPILKIKKRGEYVLNFSVKDTEKLVHLVQPFIIESMRFKIPFDPVSTEPNNRVIDNYSGARCEV